MCFLPWHHPTYRIVHGIGPVNLQSSSLFFSLLIMELIIQKRLGTRTLYLIVLKFCNVVCDYFKVLLINEIDAMTQAMLKGYLIYFKFQNEHIKKQVI
jgi:hypothetical protein